MFININEKGEVIGLSSKHGIDIPKKPTFRNDKAYFKNGKWIYYFDKLRKDNYIFFEKEDISSIAQYLVNSRSLTGEKTKKHTKDISVLIPCYNKSNTIENSINSVLAQTMLPKEIIAFLMDEESYKLKEKLESLSPLVKCYIKERMNVSKARNELVKVCNCDWLIFLDADDMLNENFIETLYNEDGAISVPSVKVIKDNVIVEHPFVAELQKNTHPTNCFHQNLTALICKELFNEYKLNEEFCNGGEDLDFYIRVVKDKKWKITYSLKTWYYYNKDSNHQLTKSNLFEESVYKVILKHKDWLIKENEKTFNFSPTSLKSWLLNNLTKENCQKALYNESYIYELYLNLNILYVNYFKELINNSKNNKPISEFNKEDFEIIGEIDGSILFQLIKTEFDVIFFDLELSSTCYLINFGSNMIVNKKVLEDIEKQKFNTEHEKFAYILKKYNCFIYNNCCKNDSIPEKEKLDDYIKNNNFKEIEKEKNIFIHNINKIYNGINDIYIISKPYEKLKITFELDKRCNKKCSYCKQVANKTLKSDEELFSNFDKALTKFENIFDEYFCVKLMGGEPSIWSDWLTNKIIERLKNYKDVIVYTNGSNRNSRFFKENNFIMVTHITDWEQKKYLISDFNNNELITIINEKEKEKKLELFINNLNEGKCNKR